MKKYIFSLLSLLVSLAPLATSAETVASDQLQAGADVRIVAPVARDLLAAGGQVTVDAAVTKNVLALGGTVTITSPVAGDVRVLGGQILIDAPVGGNVAVAGGQIVFGKNSKINGNVTVAGGMITFNGAVNGTVDVYVKEDKNLQVGSGASLASPATTHFINVPARAQNRGFGFFNLISLFGALVVGLVLVSLAPKSLRAAVGRSIKNPGKDFAWGALTLVVTPIAIFILALTIIGLPLALLLGAGYLLVIYVAKIVLGLVLGTYLIGAVAGQAKAKTVSLLWIMVLGVAVFWILGNVPVVGGLIKLAGIIWGLGILARLKWDTIKRLEA